MSEIFNPLPDVGVAVTKTFLVKNYPSKTFVNSQLTSLQDSIDTIELTPGPPGQTGVDGVAGQNGIAGKNGTNFINTVEQPINLLTDENTYISTSDNKLYSFKTPYSSVPSTRTIPNIYNGVIRNCSSQTDLTNNLSLSQSGDVLRIVSDITLTSSFIINKSLKLTADVATRKLTCSLINTPTVSITVDNVLIQNITLEHTGAGTTDSTINFSNVSASNNYVDNVFIRTNEFGLVTNNTQIQITNCDFSFVGTADSHRFIALARTTGVTILDNCIFSGNTGLSSQCIYIGNSLAADYLNGSIVVKNCNNTGKNTVQRLMMVETVLTGSNVSFAFINNSFTTSSGFVIFYISPTLDGISSITAYNNTELFYLTGTVGGKGLIGIDVASTGTLTNPLSKPYLYFNNNSLAPIRTDYTDWSFENNGGIAYITSKFTVPSSTKYYSPGQIGYVKGDKGDTGLQGLKGDKGDTGANGINGTNGTKGDTGANGTNGAKGDQGDKGDTGANGTNGINGSLSDGTFSQKIIVLNKDTVNFSSASSGIELKENNVTVGHVKTTFDNTRWELKAPAGTGYFRTPASLTASDVGKYLRLDGTGNSNWEAISVPVSDTFSSKMLTLNAGTNSYGGLSGIQIQELNNTSVNSAYARLSQDRTRWEIKGAIGGGIPFRTPTFVSDFNIGHYLRLDANYNTVWEAIDGSGGGGGSADLSSVEAKNDEQDLKLNTLELLTNSNTGNIGQIQTTVNNTTDSLNNLTAFVGQNTTQINTTKNDVILLNTANSLQNQTLSNHGDRIESLESSINPNLTYAHGSDLSLQYNNNGALAGANGIYVSPEGTNLHITDGDVHASNIIYTNNIQYKNKQGKTDLSICTNSTNTVNIGMVGSNVNILGNASIGNDILVSNVKSSNNILNVSTQANSIINIGSSTSSVNITGTLNAINVQDINVTDKNIVLNKGGSFGSSFGSGIIFEEGGLQNAGFVKVTDDRTRIELKAPGSLPFRTPTAWATSTGNILYGDTIGNSSYASGISTNGTGNLTVGAKVLVNTTQNDSTLNVGGGSISLFPATGSKMNGIYLATDPNSLGLYTYLGLGLEPSQPNDFAISTSGGTAINIRAESGNVGILKNTAQYALDVNGRIKSNAGLLPNTNGVSGQTLISDGAGNINWGDNSGHYLVGRYSSTDVLPDTAIATVSTITVLFKFASSISARLTNTFTSSILLFFTGNPTSGGTNTGSSSFNHVQNVSGRTIRLLVSFSLILPFPTNTTKMTFRSIARLNDSVHQSVKLTQTDNTVNELWHSDSFTIIVPNSSYFSITGNLYTSNNSSSTISYQTLNIQMLG